MKPGGVEVNGDKTRPSIAGSGSLYGEETCRREFERAKSSEILPRATSAQARIYTVSPFLLIVRILWVTILLYSILILSLTNQANDKS